MIVKLDSHSVWNTQEKNPKDVVQPILAHLAH